MTMMSNGTACTSPEAEEELHDWDTYGNCMNEECGAYDGNMRDEWMTYGDSD
jgi:hypothetical protein